jgi:hypothetical protein
MQRGLVMVSPSHTRLTTATSNVGEAPHPLVLGRWLLHVLVGSPRMTGTTMDDSLARSRAASDDAKRGPSLHASNHAFPTPTLRSPNRIHQRSFEPTDLSDGASCGKHCPMSVPPQTQRSPEGAHPCSCPRPTSDSHNLPSPATTASNEPKKQASPHPIPHMLAHWLLCHKVVHKRCAWHGGREIPSL